MSLEKNTMGSAEAREYVGLGRTKFNALVRAGKMPANKIGKTYVFKRSDLDAYVEAHKFRGGAKAPTPEERRRDLILKSTMYHEESYLNYHKDVRGNLPMSPGQAIRAKSDYLKLIDIGFNVSGACKRIGINRSTIQYWRTSDEAFSEREKTIR